MYNKRKSLYPNLKWDIPIINLTYEDVVIIQVGYSVWNIKTVRPMEYQVSM